jgi:hypothetical protein
MFESRRKGGIAGAAAHNNYDRRNIMVKLKICFVMGIVVSMLILCAFAPGICIDRFILPDGCCASCVDSSPPCGNKCLVEEGINCACR